MRNGGFFRVVSALLLALAVAEPALSAALAFSARTPHECADHACFCRKPAAGGPTRPCHGQDDPDAPRLSAACQHGADPVTPPFSRPGVLPPPPMAVADAAPRSLQQPSDASASDGVYDVESPPPRPRRLPRA